MILTFDTETTGFVRKNSPIADEAQPHICQLGAILSDGLGNPILESNLLICPDGWTIPDKVAEIHGITTEKALRYGLPEDPVLGIFAHFFRLATVLVAHNIEYDKSILDIACARFGRAPFNWSSKEQVCTMLHTTEICKIPSARGGYKWPKLQEIHVKLFDHEFRGAHDAMADVRACQRIYYKLESLKDQFTCPQCGSHYSILVDGGRRCSDQFSTHCTWTGSWPLI